MAILAFYSAILVYAGLSSPTPDTLSIIEISIIGLLIIGIGVLRPIRGITNNDYPATISYHRYFFTFMVSVPTVIGLVNGHDISNIMRDLIPVCALIIPLCYYQERRDALPTILVIAGALFALRYIAPVIPYLEFMKGDTSLLYLANSPLIPFAAIMGFGWLTDTKDQFLTKRLCGIAITAVCFLAMGMTLQRAPIALCALACFGILGLRSIQKPIQSLIILIGLCALLYPVWPLFVETIGQLNAKTLSVGFNNRIEEFQTVMTQSTWFGHGWGAEIQSPAVGEIWVRFTHNMWSYYWFKAGAIGFIASIIFSCVWIIQIFKLSKKNFIIGMAVFVPFIIHITLYTGFKTLDFALILTLITVRLRTN